MSFSSDNLDSVGELYTEDEFRQLVVAVESAPALLGGLGELEDHGKRGLVGETSIGAHRAVAPVRLCTSYLQSDQEQLGHMFCVLAGALALAWSLPWFFGNRNVAQSGASYASIDEDSDFS